jgi:hypothetical protein
MGWLSALWGCKKYQGCAPQMSHALWTDEVLPVLELSRHSRSGRPFSIFVKGFARKSEAHPIATNVAVAKYIAMG